MPEAPSAVLVQLASSPCRKASSCTRASGESSEPVTIKPIRGIFADGWAFTGSGKAAAAPPSSVMNSRRFTSNLSRTSKRKIALLEAYCTAGFSSSYDRYGSVASHPDVRDAHGMSAMPPIATQSVRHNETSQCANFGLESTVPAYICPHGVVRSPHMTESGCASLTVVVQRIHIHRLRIEECRRS
jgi:hypothetical protein